MTAKYSAGSFAMRLSGRTPASRTSAHSCRKQSSRCAAVDISTGVWRSGRERKNSNTRACVSRCLPSGTPRAPPPRPLPVARRLPAAAHRGRQPASDEGTDPAGGGTARAAVASPPSVRRLLRRRRGGRSGRRRWPCRSRRRGVRRNARATESEAVVVAVTLRRCFFMGAKG